MYSRGREISNMGVGVLQPWHLIVIVVIVLVIFGPGKLPMLGKAVGDSVRDFKKAISNDEHGRTADAQLPPGTTLCPNCHKSLLVADRFCGNCGARTDVAAV
jgi:sec-independent protein translocase protein TatA